MKALFVFACFALSSCAIEKPEYRTVKKEGKFEVREYASIPVVSTAMGDMEQRNTSFRKLFRYIGGENAKQQKVSMTAPVFVNDDSAGTKGRMSFMIPSDVANQGAPSPSSEAVSLDEIQGGTFAVLRFKDWKNDQARKNAAEELSAMISKYQLSPTGEKFFAFYNPPITPELLRRNEVWQRVQENE